VPKVDAQVELDAALLTAVDALAGRLGLARNEVIEDSIRRGLAARVLGDVISGVRDRSDLTEERATEIAYHEVKAARADPRASSPDTDGGDPPR
jgi:metal-responsive CopG/Arc/MetJ family transcriptional regulator